jgi:hypothetical protein
MAAVVGLLGIAAGPAEADWTSIGPYGDSVIVAALALDPTTPNTLYAGTGTFSWTAGRVFKWTCCTLTVWRAGGGEGTVTSSPPGIVCRSDCGADYTAGTAVALTATPSAGRASPAGARGAWGQASVWSARIRTGT